MAIRWAALGNSPLVVLDMLAAWSVHGQKDTESFTTERILETLIQSFLFFFFNLWLHIRIIWRTLKKVRCWIPKPKPGKSESQGPRVKGYYFWKHPGWFKCIAWVQNHWSRLAVVFYRWRNWAWVQLPCGPKRSLKHPSVKPQEGEKTTHLGRRMRVFVK